MKIESDPVFPSPAIGVARLQQDRYRLGVGSRQQSIACACRSPTAEWGVSELGRRAKFYQITTAGRRQLARETASWRRFADAIQLVLQFA